MIIYSGPKDLSADHVRYLVDRIHWEWEHCAFEHIRDWSDYCAMMADEESDQRAWDAREEEQSREYLRQPMCHDDKDYR